MPLSTSGAPSSLDTCRELLAHVSRTFALTIPILDEPLRTEVGISYLICRIADTIEDRSDLMPDTREQLYDALLVAVSEPRNSRCIAALDELWPEYSDPHHNALFRRSADVFACFARLEEPARTATRQCVSEMIDGMRVHAGVPNPEDPHFACANLAELDAYCHFVAGTVGILLTRLFASELGSAWRAKASMEDGRRFGLGLQLVNVLKDHASDRERGVVFLPRDCFSGNQLLPESRRTLVRRAVGYLDAAHRYVLALPCERTDMRLFCVLAQHLALATLELVAQGVEPAKVSREHVTTVISRAREAARSDVALTALHTEYRARVLTSD